LKPSNLQQKSNKISLATANSRWPAIDGLRMAILFNLHFFIPDNYHSAHFSVQKSRTVKLSLQSVPWNNEAFSTKKPVPRNALKSKSLTADLSYFARTGLTFHISSLLLTFGIAA
jgi:hypothetical protein